MRNEITWTLAIALAATRAAALAGDIRITTAQAFDATGVPAYTGTHDAVYAHVDAHQAEHLEQLRRWVRQPSVSAEGRGIAEMAALVRDDLQRLGFQETEIVPTTGHPVVWGYHDAGAPKTLLVYMMYDVQPVEPEQWKVPPFDGAIVETELGKVLMARGAANQKGPERAFLNALESILAVEKRLPVNLMVTAEGEEELGSPHYPEAVERLAVRLQKASGVLFPFPSQSPDGGLVMYLGVKGLLYLELEASGGPRGGPTRSEIHGSYQTLVDAPAWRLVQALSTLTSPDGNTISVPGYYDSIRPPSDEEQRLVNGMLKSWSGQEALTQKALGVERWIGGLGGKDALLRYLFGTTLNIDGLVSGYTGPGTKTILPHKAVAKVDSRLVPDQTPEEALRLIKTHLAAMGFGDIEVRQLSGYPPAQTSVEAPIVRAAIGVYNKHGLTPSVSPRLGGSAPYYVFTQKLKLPLAAVGLGHGSGAHAPDEYLVVEPKPGSRIAGLAAIEKAYVDLLYAMAVTR